MGDIYRPDGSVYCLIETAPGKVIKREIHPPGTVPKETLEYFQCMANNSDTGTGDIAIK